LEAWKMRLARMLKRFVKDERGLETVEYAIILGLIVAATIGLVIALGLWVQAQFQNTVTAVEADVYVP
jgi:Flp pilus assembly pilin Flp